MRVVRLAPIHLDQVASLEMSDGDMGWTRDHFEKELTLDVSRFFVIEDGPLVLGYGGYWKVSDEAQITNLVVCRAHRRQGLATRLLGAIVKSAADDGCIVATLDVRAGNLAAQTLYRNAGFTESGRRPQFYSDPNEDALLMEKKWGVRI